jgi:hypothetical protein
VTGNAVNGTISCGHLDIAADDPLAHELGLGAVALRYAALGIPVFPLQPGAKRPLERSNGFKDASLDPAVIRSWWSGGGRSRNIGIATGSLLVIDLDRKRSDGPAEFTRWLAWYRLALPLGPWADTPSNGRHVYLRLPPGCEVHSRNGVLPDVDVKAAGGYVVASPSAVATAPMDRPGERSEGEVFIPYVTHGCLCSVPVAPDPFLAALSLLSGTVPPPAVAGGAAQSSGGALPPTEELLKTGLCPGQRNHQAYALACRLWRSHGLSGGAQVSDTCHAVWQATSQAGGSFPWPEMQRRIGYARAYVERSDRQMLATTRQFLAALKQNGNRG